MITNEISLSNNHTLHRSETRGYANHGWLEARHTFSFAGYINPERIHFGVLRVLNDDRVSGGMGFGTHPHDNMEIITIPLEGALEHRDSMGNLGVIRKGDVQVMSAGTGITHSEYNHHPDQDLKLFQIWVFPDRKNVPPRYDQKSFDIEGCRNSLQSLVSPHSEDGSSAGLWIYQNVWFHRGIFDEGARISYPKRIASNGIYSIVIEGRFLVDGVELDRRDGLGIKHAESSEISITAQAPDSELLLLELPMSISP
ncbi:MAG: pirin family protein [Sphingomonadales bacterium]|nr:pirin family protein [Sphingomonadales bacterium]